MSSLTNKTNFMYCIDSIIEHIKIDAFDDEYYHRVMADLYSHLEPMKEDMTVFINDMKRSDLKISFEHRINKTLESLRHLKKDKNVTSSYKYFKEPYKVVYELKKWFDLEFNQ